MHNLLITVCFLSALSFWRLEKTLLRSIFHLLNQIMFPRHVKKTELPNCILGSDDYHYRQYNHGFFGSHYAIIYAEGNSYGCSNMAHKTLGALYYLRSPKEGVTNHQDIPNQSCSKIFTTLRTLPINLFRSVGGGKIM